MHQLKRSLPYLLLIMLIAAAVWQGVEIHKLAKDTQDIAGSISALQSRQDALEAKIEAASVNICPLPSPPKPAGELLTPSGLTVQELESGLHDGLKPYAEAFIHTEQNTGVNAVFLASVAALESGWASSDVAESMNNLFGWTDAGSYMEFGSKEECIFYVAERIKELYLSPDGAYFNGYSVEAINVWYNGSPEWETEIRQIMSEILERSTADE